MQISIKTLKGTLIYHIKKYLNQHCLAFIVHYCVQSLARDRTSKLILSSLALVDVRQLLNII